jgi:hypothetical protein
MTLIDRARNLFLWSRFIAAGSFFLWVMAYVQAAELGKESRSDKDRVQDKSQDILSPQSKAGIDELNRRFGEEPILPKPEQEKANLQGSKKQDDEKVPGSLPVEPNEKSGHGHHLEGACALQGLSKSECDKSQDILSPQSKAGIDELNRRFGEEPILPKPEQEKATGNH